MTTRALRTSALSLALPLMTAAAMAALSGGTLGLPVSAFNGGGAVLTSGALTAYTAIGAMGMAMTGGTLSLAPGVISSASTARQDLLGAHAFPTPFIPSQGHTRITFTQLPERATIHVYSLAGRLVKTLSKDDSTDSVVWSPVASDQGAALVSGVYLFVVEQPGFGKKIGKLMVIR